MPKIVLPEPDRPAALALTLHQVSLAFFQFRIMLCQRVPEIVHFRAESGIAYASAVVIEKPG